jgi:hypothetical protein
MSLGMDIGQEAARAGVDGLRARGPLHHPATRLA